MKKQIKLSVPEYLTVKEYQDIFTMKTDSQLEFLIHVICVFGNIPNDEVREWSIDSLREASTKILEVTNITGEFYPIVEFNDKVYGYSQLEKVTLGEFIDLEYYSKDSVVNLHKIATTLYRPIIKHKFGTWQWDIKSAWKQANNKVENPLEYYTVEKYNLENCQEREQEFEDFPVHLVLGALSFFLTTILGSQISSLYSQEIVTEQWMNLMEQNLMNSLSENTGGGLLYSTTYPKRESFLFPEIKPSLN